MATFGAFFKGNLSDDAKFVHTEGNGVSNEFRTRLPERDLREVIGSMLRLVEWIISPTNPIYSGQFILNPYHDLRPFTFVSGPPRTKAILGMIPLPNPQFEVTPG